MKSGKLFKVLGLLLIVIAIIAAIQGGEWRWITIAVIGALGAGFVLWG